MRIKQKRITIIALIVLGVLILSSCSNSNKSVDAEFLNDFAKAVETTVTIEDDSLQDAFRDALKSIEKYTDAEFDDGVLKEKAIVYINCLRQCVQEGIDYISITNLAVAQIDIIDSYSVKLNSNAQEAIAEMRDVLLLNSQSSTVEEGNHDNINSIDDKEKGEVKNDNNNPVYTAIAIMGAIITSSDPNSPKVSYIGKCEVCGYVDGATVTAENENGIWSSFYCPSCGENQPVEIRIERR